MKKLLFVCSLLLASLASADTAFQTYYPPGYAWASKPTCSAAITGMQIRVTDVGPRDWIAACDGTNWMPVGASIILAQSGAALSAHTGTTNETIQVTVSIPAGILGANGLIDAKATFTPTGTAGTKTIRFRLGTTGTSSSQLGARAMAAATTGSGQYWNLTYNRNAANSQATYGAIQVSNGEGGSMVATAVDTASAQNIYITFALANSGDSMTLEDYAIVLYPSP